MMQLETIALSRELFISLGAPGLFVLAILEFFFVPIPPFVVLLPLALANPEFALVYAASATAGSVLAGGMGYLVGRKGGRPVLESRVSNERIRRIETYFERNGFVTLTVGALAPIPEGYELLSIASGVLKVDTRLFVLAALLGRGGKYFLVAGVALLFGESVRSMGEVEFYSMTGAVTIAVLTAYLFRRHWWPGRWRLAS